MNKKEFITEVNNKTGLTKRECRLCLDAIIDVIKNALKQGESVTLTNFGKFKVSEKKPKQMYSFVTKRTQILSARRTPTFRASDTLKQSIK